MSDDKMSDDKTEQYLRMIEIRDEEIKRLEAENKKLKATITLKTVRLNRAKDLLINANMKKLDEQDQ